MVTTGLTTDQIIGQLGRTMGLTNADLAAVLAVSPARLAGWRTTGATPSSEAWQRLTQLSTLADRLQETFVAADVPHWLRSKNRYLKGETPIDALRRGRIDLVEGALEIVDSGIFL